MHPDTREQLRAGGRALAESAQERESEVLGVLAEFADRLAELIPDRWAVEVVPEDGDRDLVGFGATLEEAMAIAHRRQVGDPESLGHHGPGRYVVVDRTTRQDVWELAVDGTERDLAEMVGEPAG
jgi:hypothetical protein